MLKNTSKYKHFYYYDRNITITIENCEENFSEQFIQ